MRIVLICFLFFTNLCFSQIWVKNNATWIFDYYYTQIGDPLEYEEHFGYIKVSHVGDTIIQTKLCKKFETKEYRYTGTPGNLGSLESISVLNYNYTFANEDTVFMLMGNQFQVLLNFDLQIGDSIPINYEGEEMGIGSCNDTSFTKIIDKGLINLQGFDYRFIENSQSSWPTWYEMNGKYTDRFGPLQFFLFPNYSSACSVSGHQNRTYNLLCFKDDEFEIDFTANSECPAYFLLALEENLANNQLKFFPNPSSDFITIEGDFAQYDFILRDNLGHEILEQKASSKLDLSALESGIYFLFISDKGEIKQIEKIVKN